NGIFRAMFVVDTQECGGTEITAYGLSSKVESSKDFTIVSNIVQVTPSRGSVGTIVNVLGTGYENSELIKVDFGTTASITTTTSSVYGMVSISFTIDTQVSGTTTVVVIGLQSNESSGSSFIISGNIVSITPTRATVGTVVSLLGNGYGADEVVDINFGKTLPITTITTGIDGLFSTIFTVDVQKCGTTTMSAIGRISKESVTMGINIYSNIWQVSPNTGPVGTIITVSGNGFDQLEVVRVDFGISRSMCEPVTSQNGSWTVVFTVNTQVSGNIAIIAEGADSGQKASSVFVIAGKVFVTPNSGTIGRVVRVYGEGFSKREWVKVDFGITPSVANVLTTTNGTFSTTFTIDTQSAGTTTILVKETKDGGISAGTTLYIHGNVVMVTPNRGTIGTMIEVSGNGYGANEQLRIEFGSTPSIGNALASSIGTFTAAFTMDTQGSGITTITAHGLVSGEKAAGTVTICAQIILVTPTRATVGTLIYIEGTGFTASENIRMKLGINAAIIVPNTVYASNYGSFATTFTVDTQPSGDTQIFVYSYPTAQTSEDPKAYSSLVIYSNITAITPSKGTVGSFVTVYGNGYGLSEAVRIDFGKKASMSMIAADESGKIISIFTVDTQEFGTTTITAEGLFTGEISSGLYCIKANIILTSPTKGSVGTVITLAGNGYGDNTGEFIRVDFGTTPSISVIRANSRGEFLTTFTIDTQVRGPTTITAEGLTTEETVLSSVQIYANITTLTPTRGSVGTIITLVANGYGPTEQMKVDFGAMSEIIDVYADIAGAFSTTFTVDTQVSGTKTVIVIGRTSLEQDQRLFYLHANIAQSTPIAGTIGTPITIEGHGFGRYEPIRVNFGTTNAIISPLPTAEENGTFVYTFTADAQVNGPNRILATGMDTNEKGYATFTVQVQVTTFKPTFGSVGTKVTIIGDGYSGSEIVRISLGTNRTITTVTSNAAGEFTTTFTIDTQPGGTTSVIAYGLDCQQDELKIFRIHTNVVVISPGQGSVGTPIFVTGNGYLAEEGIRLDFGLTATRTEATCDNRGYFEASFTIDTQKFGTTTIRATGLTSSEQSEKTLLIRSNIILVTPSRATVGTIISVDGNGYGDDENIKLDFGYTPDIQQTLTNAAGEFNTSFTVDTQPCGTTTILATGAVSHEVSQDGLSIYAEVITVSPSRGSVGTIITVGGTGYGATETVAIELGWTVTRTTTITDYTGYFSTTLTIDAQPCCTTTVKARGIASGEADNDRLVIFSNIYEVSPVWGMVGELVTIYANGFGANEAIEINFGITPTIACAATDYKGAFTGIFTVDVQPAGWTTITAYGINSHEVAANKYRISAKITVLTPSHGTVGTIVRVDGNAFIATDLVTIDFGWTKAITEIVCDDLGVFSTTFTINTQPVGIRTVVANSTKNIDLYAFQIFTIEPHITRVLPDNGTVGTLITVSGDGYAATETVRIDFGLTTSRTNVVSDYRGGFEKTFTIDIQPYGITNVIATGMDSYATEVDSLLIKGNITNILPAFGTVGSRVTVTGNGFTAEESLQIPFGYDVITDTNANSYGEFTAYFTVNTQAAGTTTVEVIALLSPQDLIGGFYIHGNVLSMTPIDG
ncbi:MAG: hypothetical protein AAB296_00855, partial [Candidatus Desantisbacteria bacterium]